MGSWRCLRLLGAGRWTEVYQAAPRTHSQASADYVLKTLKSEWAEDPAAIRMLEREAYLCSAVLHPHLQSILAAQLETPPRYLVMPWMEGASLRETLQHAKRLSTPQSLWIIRQLSEALQALHSHGWLHGDVKPDNVFLSCSGHASLIDLGLARPFRPASSQPSALSGTPAYAAPELGHSAVLSGPGCDIYSLGITLFEMLTGCLPFPADAPAQLLAAHRDTPMPDPRRYLPWLSHRVGRLLRRMLAKQPLRRPDASELIDWLVDLEIETLEERLPA